MKFLTIGVYKFLTIGIKNVFFVAVSGYIDRLDPDIEIDVPDDDSGLYAIDLLDPSWVSL